MHLDWHSLVSKSFVFVKGVNRRIFWLEWISQGWRQLRRGSNGIIPFEVDKDIWKLKDLESGIILLLPLTLHTVTISHNYLGFTILLGIWLESLQYFFNPRHAFRLEAWLYDVVYIKIKEKFLWYSTAVQCLCESCGAQFFYISQSRSHL